VGYRTNLLTGIASLIDSAGLATWRSSGSYTAAQTGIVLGTVPSTPDRIVTLTGYGVDDDPTLSDTTTGVQVRARWGGQDPRPVDDLADSIFDLLHNAGPLTLPTGIRVVQIHRQSSTPLGQDTNARWSRSDNYYVTTHRPSPHRI
jgi:hypothetical protein